MSSETKPKVVGLGGWLGLFVAGWLFLTPGCNALQYLTRLRLSAEAQHFTLEQHDALLMAGLGHVLAGLAVYYILIAPFIYFLLRRDRRFPRVAIAYNLTFAALVVGVNLVWGTLADQQTAIASCLGMLLWTAYLKSSVRVHNTFTV